MDGDNDVNHHASGYSWAGESEEEVVNWTILEPEPADQEKQCEEVTIDQRRYDFLYRLGLIEGLSEIGATVLSLSSNDNRDDSSPAKPLPHREIVSLKWHRAQLIQRITRCPSRVPSRTFRRFTNRTSRPFFFKSSRLFLAWDQETINNSAEHDDPEDEDDYLDETTEGIGFWPKDTNEGAFDETVEFPIDEMMRGDFSDDEVNYIDDMIIEDLSDGETNTDEPSDINNVVEESEDVSNDEASDIDRKVCGKPGNRGYQPPARQHFDSHRLITPRIPKVSIEDEELESVGYWWTRCWYWCC